MNKTDKTREALNGAGAGAGLRRRRGGREGRGIRVRVSHPPPAPAVTQTTGCQPFPAPHSFCGPDPGHFPTLVSRRAWNKPHTGSRGGTHAPHTSRPCLILLLLSAVSIRDSSVCITPQKHPPNTSALFPRATCKMGAPAPGILPRLRRCEPSVVWHVDPGHGRVRSSDC